MSIAARDERGRNRPSTPPKTFTCEIPIRWGDCDRLGHVNNTKFFEYAQEARVQFYGACIYVDGHAPARAAASVLRRTEMEFLRPLTERSGPLSVDVEVVHLGTSSYSFRQVMRAADGETCAVATALMVGFDLKTQAPRELSEAERAALTPYLVDRNGA